MQKIAMLAMTVTAAVQSKWRSAGGGDDYSSVEVGTPRWWIYGGTSIFLVCFAGIMSGLTLGLMSLSLMDLKVLQTSGTDLEKKQAVAITPVVTKQHQLLVTLLLCNAVAMEALPIFLDKMFNEWMTVILSVTFVLAFGEVIPQAICSRYGLAVGANMVWLVNVLMLLCWPIAYPIGLLLDYLLGHDNSALFRRAQLKALVSIHGKEAGGYLTLDETTIIAGALDLTEKTAAEAMTPIESTFSLDINAKLDWETLGRIMARGHSRVPVYSGSPQNIVGLLLVKSLLKVRAEEKTPVSTVSIRRIPRVPEDMPLYDILNEFQKGGSHMAAVVRVKQKKRNFKFSPQTNFGQKEDHDRKGVKEYCPHAESDIDDDEESDKAKLDHIETSDVVGIITMEDVMEELLQSSGHLNVTILTGALKHAILTNMTISLRRIDTPKVRKEIVDETDEYIDVHKRIRVVTAAAAQMRAPVRAALPQPCPAQLMAAPVPNMDAPQDAGGLSTTKQTQQQQEAGHISVDAIATYRQHTTSDHNNNSNNNNKYNPIPKMEKSLTQPLLGSCPREANSSLTQALLGAVCCPREATAVSRFSKDRGMSSVIFGTEIFSSVVTV